MIRNTKDGAFMVLIQFFRENKVQRESLLEHLKKHFDITSLLYCINSKANDDFTTKKSYVMMEKTYITEEMEGLLFKINAKSFFQTNSKQAYELYKIARDFAGLKGLRVGLRFLYWYGNHCSVSRERLQQGRWE